MSYDSDFCRTNQADESCYYDQNTLPRLTMRRFKNKYITPISSPRPNPRPSPVDSPWHSDRYSFHTPTHRPAVPSFHHSSSDSAHHTQSHHPQENAVRVFRYRCDLAPQPSCRLHRFRVQRCCRGCEEFWMCGRSSWLFRVRDRRRGQRIRLSLGWWRI